MAATYFSEQDNPSFSKILLSKEVAEIIKQVVRESTRTVHLKCDEEKIVTSMSEKLNSCMTEH
ncbi:MAG: hypothetical protein CO032_06465 [Nitrosopumilales archaeon CG_4_9_14_0_2_um_filter_34_16]|nr:MAG: hypothetical protein CO032_06465 [Nitrosopumilales archaeon CG_4_9_14_0_2_um_filter_34_16]